MGCGLRAASSLSAPVAPVGSLVLTPGTIGGPDDQAGASPGAGEDANASNNAGTS
jgi:hypothetical protein